MSYPLKPLKGLDLWESLNSSLDDLIEAEHIIETSPRIYIVEHLYSRICGLKDPDTCKND